MEDKLNEIKYEEDYERMRCRGLQIVDYDLYKTTRKNYLELLFLLFLLATVILLLLGMFSGYQLGIDKGFALGFIAG